MIMHIKGILYVKQSSSYTHTHTYLYIKVSNFFYWILIIKELRDGFKKNAKKDRSCCKTRAEIFQVVGWQQ